MKQVLAIDEGTTGVTCLMLSADGVVTGRGYRELTQYFPQPGWVEHDASEIFERTISAARDAIGESGTVPDAIGITNQRETIVVWDRDTGEPLTRAIVWQDRRTAERCRELAPRAAEITALTGPANRRASRCGRGARWNDGHVAHLEADEGRCSRD